jgi:hypothetical protein
MEYIENTNSNQLEEDVNLNNENYQNSNFENINNNNEINNNEIEEENNNIEEKTEGSELMYIYEWVDSIQLSRQKKNIARDFCDGVLFAEIIKNYFPKLVDLHNYPSCSSTKQKISNWKTLNEKVLKKINLKINNNEINDVINCKPLAIENLLQKLYFVLSNKFNSENQNNFYNNLYDNNGNINVENLRNILNEKENAVKELNDVIKIFEMKLEGANNYIKKLEEKVNNLTEKIRSKGYNI